MVAPVDREHLHCSEEEKEAGYDGIAVTLPSHLLSLIRPSFEEILSMNRWVYLRCGVRESGRGWEHPMELEGGYLLGWGLQSEHPIAEG